MRKALASGYFTQTVNTLQDGNSFCCHGVACLIAEQNGIPVYRSVYGRLFGDGIMYQRHVMRWMGISIDEIWERVEWNDKDQLPFSEIAKRY